MAIVETILAVPVLGGLIVLTTVWTVLGVTLALHIATLVYSANTQTSKISPILGIVTSVIGFVPVVGWIMHIITAVFYWVNLPKFEVKSVVSPATQTEVEELKKEIEELKTKV